MRLFLICSVALMVFAGVGRIDNALAGGLEVGDQGAKAAGRGGAFTVRADDPSALYYNPAGLARLRGTQVYYSHRLLYGQAEYRRARTLDWSDATHGTPQLVDFEHVTNQAPLFPTGLMLAASSDFGLDYVTFGAGVYGPPAVGHVQYPEHGPQRYQLIEMDVLVMYYTLAAAWKYADTFGVGLSLQWVDAPRVNFDMVVDGTVSPRNVNPVESQFDIRSRFRGADHVGFTCILGMWYRPWDFLEFAIAGRLVPVNVEAEGTLNVDAVTLNLEDILLTRNGQRANDVSFSMNLPPKIRAGVRYIHRSQGRELFDIELGLHYEMWSLMERYQLKADLVADVMSQLVEIDAINIEKNWKDTFSIRLGSDYHLIDQVLTLRAGLFFETAGVDPAYAYLDAMSFTRWSPSLGLTYHVAGFDVSAAYAYVIQDVAVVTEDEAKVYQQVPGSPCQAPYDDPNRCDEKYLGQPAAVANAGTYIANYHLFNLGVAYRF